MLTSVFLIVFSAPKRPTGLTLLASSDSEPKQVFPLMPVNPNTPLGQTMPGSLLPKATPLIITVQMNTLYGFQINTCYGNYLNFYRSHDCIV